MKPLPIFNTILRLLTFRVKEEELARLDFRFLGIGLLGTWLVGMGRFWDSPNANFFQKAGLGSLIYVFVLASILFVVGIPLRPHDWRYRKLLIFITLTSFPAALYAIPVERWTSIATASLINQWFLAAVATYRVALYLFFMGRGARLGAFTALVAAMFPIALMIGLIVMSGQTGVVFDLMAGLRDREPTAQDGVNAVLNGISLFGCIGTPFWAIAYGALIAAKSRQDSSGSVR